MQMKQHEKRTRKKAKNVSKHIFLLFSWSLFVIASFAFFALFLI